MATTVDYQTQLAELQEALERARKAKKSTKELRAQIAEVERQAEQATAEAVEVEAPEVEAETAEVETPKRRGRPRKYSDEYYALRDQFKRNGRGRPKREQVETDLRVLGVTEDVSQLGTREVEQLFKTTLQERLAEVA